MSVGPADGFWNTAFGNFALCAALFHEMPNSFSIGVVQFVFLLILHIVIIIIVVIIIIIINIVYGNYAWEQLFFCPIRHITW